MNVILRVIIIGGIVFLTSDLHAAQDRDQLINQALDHIEEGLNGNKVNKNIAFVDSEPGVYLRDNERETIQPREPTFRQEPKSRLKISESDKEDSSLMGFELGTEIFYHKFKEPGITRQSGCLYGLQGAYTYRTSFNEDVRAISDLFSDRDKLNMFRLEGLVAFGSVDFESDSAGDHNGRGNFMYDIRALAGYDFLYSDNLIFTPYMGIAYRYLRDKSPGRILPFASFSGVFSFKRESEYLYMPFGVTTTKKLKRGWVMDVTMEYDLFLDGDQTNHYDDGGLKVRANTGELFVIDSIEFDQDKGYGFRGSVKFINESERANYFIEPYFRYWKIRDSETQQFTSNGGRVLWFDGTGTIPRLGNQPKNETSEIGLKLGLRY
ncbi:MAG: autotransporter outer membrane beta-barrel domain-containing protein [Candidatus Omnitrophica bacterium]|nr:autotransporter outer membrane beta-barrel domain-containing protein [Candidatus Omnitrophota bacterium]